MRFFSDQEIKVIALIVSAATLVALAITIAVGLSRRDESSAIQETAADRREPVHSSDLIIPEEFTLTGGERWYFSREPLHAWSEEQVEAYWIDPTQISIDLLEEETDTIVREFVEGLP